jgi:hypothetical protein
MPIQARRASEWIHENQSTRLRFVFVFPWEIGFELPSPTTGYIP